MSGSDQPKKGIEAALDALIRAHAGPSGLVHELLPYRHKIEEALKAGVSATKIAGAIQHALGDQYRTSSIRKAIPLVAARATRATQKSASIQARKTRRAAARKPDLRDQPPAAEIKAAEDRLFDPVQTKAPMTPGLFDASRDIQTNSNQIRTMTDER